MLKHKTIWLGLSIAILLLAVLLLAGCSSLRKVNAQEFMELSRASQGNSAQNAQVIGASWDRAYLQYWNAIGIFGANTTVYWTPLSELPEDFVSKIKDK